MVPPLLLLILIKIAMAPCSQTKTIDFDGALPNLGGALIEMMPPNQNPKYASADKTFHYN